MSDALERQIHTVALARAVRQAAARMNRIIAQHQRQAGFAAASSRARISPISCASGRDLTGTHLGCEHGVCGACTILVDGAPARSCITFAVACDGAEVVTIEGFDDDAITARAARGVHARARAAMRLLHAGHAGLRARHRAAQPRRRRARHPRRDERQSLPLHRLRRHRQGDQERDHGAAGT